MKDLHKVYLIYHNFDIKYLICNSKISDQAGTYIHLGTPFAELKKLWVILNIHLSTENKVMEICTYHLALSNHNILP